MTPHPKLTDRSKRPAHLGEHLGRVRDFLSVLAEAVSLYAFPVAIFNVTASFFNEIPRGLLRGESQGELQEVLIRPALGGQLLYPPPAFTSLAFERIALGKGHEFLPRIREERRKYSRIVSWVGRAAESPAHLVRVRCCFRKGKHALPIPLARTSFRAASRNRMTAFSGSLSSTSLT